MSRMASPGGGHSSTSLGVMTPVAFPPPRSSLFSGRNVEASTPQSNGKRSTKKASPVGSLPATSSSPVVGALSPRASPTPPESSSSSPPPPKDLDGSSPPPPPPSFLANSPSSPSRAPRGRNKKQQRELPGQKTLTLGSLTTSSTSTGNGARGRLAGLAGPSQNGNGALNNNNTTTTTATATPAKTAAKSKLLYAGLHAAAFPPLSAATGPAPKETSESDLIGGLPSLWEVYCTPDTKLPYFYNAISKHVQWHVPVPPKEYVDQFGPINIPGIGPLNHLRPGGGIPGKQGGSNSSAPSNILYGPLGSNLFVFHIPTEWTEPVLFRHFAPFGNVVSCKIQTNTQTGRRSGFGFVSYDNPASAIAAIRAMNGYAVCGKFLKVQLKKGEEHLLPPDLASSQQQQQQQSQQQGQQHAHPPHHHSQSQLTQPTPPPLTPQQAP